VHVGWADDARGDDCGVVGHKLGHLGLLPLVVLIIFFLLHALAALTPTVCPQRAIALCCPSLDNGEVSVGCLKARKGRFKGRHGTLGCQVVENVVDGSGEVGKVTNRTVHVAREGLLPVLVLEMVSR
jgi:hypothetical protein